MDLYVTRKYLARPKFFLYSLLTDLVGVKNYAVHQSLEDPGSASQQSECNDPAPH